MPWVGEIGEGDRPRVFGTCVLGDVSVLIVFEGVVFFSYSLP